MTEHVTRPIIDTPQTTDDVEFDRLDAGIIMQVRASKTLERYDLMRRFPDHSLGTLFRRIERLLEMGVLSQQLDGAYRKLSIKAFGDDVTA